MLTPMSRVADLPRTASLPAIITAARAGALDHAWALFDSSGYATATNDAAALAVKGRLLKDRAMRAAPEAQPAAFARAAQAYGAADAIAPQPYTRINMATLTLLAGDRTAAARQATDLLVWIDTQTAIAETPYYLAATRAEAWLLCGDMIKADALLAKAIASDPDGWDDHAATLRQFSLILSALGGDRGWLDKHRPPPVLHFAGHLGVAAQESEALRAAIDARLAARRIGSGYGALAAGADIVVAEALLAHGAALHIVLPTGIDAFVAQSVSPYDTDWMARFVACLGAAASVQTVTGVAGAYEPLATQLAADVAMGSAVLAARRLETTAQQWLVVDDGPGPYGSGLGTARDGARWLASGRDQQIIVWPRNAPVLASGAKSVEGRSDRRLMALLHVMPDRLDDLDETEFAEAIDLVLAPMHAQAGTIVPQPDANAPSGNGWLFGFTHPEAARTYARALLALDLPRPLRIAGHYALVHMLADSPTPIGRGVSELSTFAGAALPGTLTVSEAFAAGLCAEATTCPLIEPIGEAGAIRLFALSESGAQ